MEYPISFSIPACKIVQDIQPKIRYMSRMIPDDKSSYIYETEEAYTKQYRESVFAKTTRKAGWDCLRHYEILAAGAIPYFPDLPNCPSRTMVTFPKELVLKGNRMFEEGASKQECLVLANELLDYTRQQLTTTAIARSLLDTVAPSAKKVLFLSANQTPDYLRCLTLHGLKSLPVICNDVPRIHHLYTDCTIPSAQLYGRGFTYAKLLDPACHDSDACQTVEQDIRERTYDIILYGNYHRGMPYYEHVMQHYPPSNVVLLDGEDIHSCNRDIYTRRGHPVFVREL